MGGSYPYPPGLGQEWLVQHLFRPLPGPLALLAVFGCVALFALWVWGMMRLSSGGRRRVTAICTFLAGLFYALAFFLPPGNVATGSAEIGGQRAKFTADITWDEIPDPNPPAPPAEGEEPPEEPSWREPRPIERNLTGRLELTELANEPTAQDGRDFLTISGKQNADGTWALESLGPDGPTPLVATSDGGYAVTTAAGTGRLQMRVQPAANIVKGYEAPLANALNILGGFAIFLGLINLSLVHGRTLFGAKPGWINSLAFFFGLLGMIIFGLAALKYKDLDPTAPQPFVAAAYAVMFDGLLKPLQSTTFALLGFFIVSAAYRAFRVRTTEAALMTIVAFIVMLGQVPLGQMLTAWIPLDSPWAVLRIETVTNWLLVTPNTAASRGILFGAAAGSFALSLRVWLSLERGAYFGKEF